VTKQVHDWEPGIKRSGLFWTIPLPARVFSHRGGSWARFHAQGLPMPDYHDFVNAISPSPRTKPGHVSFDVRWHGDASTVGGTATIEFRARDDRRGVVYTSLPGGQTTVGSSAVGFERNGVFFQPAAGDSPGTTSPVS
jgi:hypothetical protein